MRADSERYVESGAVRLWVREHGREHAADGPHVVLVHGYPDDQGLWDGVVERLEGVHTVTYDVRGAGRSSAPSALRDYRVDRLRDDLVAVVEATLSQGAAFHLVGHDWGSIQGWDAVVDPRLSGRVATFVSASGPSVDHLAVMTRSRRGLGRLRQLARSSYVGLYQVPLLPERMWRTRHALTPVMLRPLAAQDGPAEWTPTLGRNAANGVKLYRANMVPKLLRPRPPKVDVPVVQVVARQDAFVGERYLAAAVPHCRDLRRVEIDARHWHPRSRPELLAGVIRDVVAGGSGT